MPTNTWPAWSDAAVEKTDPPLAADVRQHTFTGLTNGTWQVRVRAQNDAGDTDADTNIKGITSEVRTVTVWPRPTPTCRACRPAPPSLSGSGNAYYHLAAAGPRPPARWCTATPCGTRSAAPTTAPMKRLPCIPAVSTSTAMSFCKNPRTAGNQRAHQRHVVRGGDQVPQRQRRQRLAHHRHIPTGLTSLRNAPENR